jgi:archaeosine synthase alpha-subunit
MLPRDPGGAPPKEKPPVRRRRLIGEDGIVVRSVERLEGLALLGTARVGPLTFPTPSLVESGPRAPEADGLRVRSESGPAGLRPLVLSDGHGELALPFPVLAPEVQGAPAGPLPVADGVALVHGPNTTAGPGGPFDLVALGNARALWSDGRPFVRAVRQLRDALGGAPVLWAPRVALPHRIPLLVYLGVDLVDTTEGLLAASRGEFLDPTLGSLTAPPEGCCECAGCASGGPDALARHAVAAYRRSLAEARSAARLGRLRELVESRLPAEPALAEMLRYADQELGPLLEERCAVAARGSRNYVILESHRRPEMARFRHRLLERYRPPPSKTVLLLVPCSRTKPYRNSRSHRRFASAWEGLPSAERLHVVSVSSPIGLVPRELEDVPPARHYDIPVTGEWVGPERDALHAGLRHLLANGQYRSVVVHLDPEEYSFLRPALPESLSVGWTIADDRTTTAEAIHALRDALSAALESERPVPGGPLAVVREELREVASFQFGRVAADRLFSPAIRLAGRPWFQRITDARNDLATLREERGLFHLTVAGARRLMPNPPLAVSVDPALSLSGDLFAPGVRSADPAIRAGDSVILLRAGGLAGVGEAVLPGRLMTELGHGLAVRVRHREHGSTDTPMTEDEPASDPGPVV